MPALGTDVSIDTAGGATVTLQAGDAASINSLTIGGKDTLLVTGGALTTTAGLDNGGTIAVSAGCHLTVGGSYTEAAGATLSMPGGGDPTFPTTNLIGNSDFESPSAGNDTTEPDTWIQYGSNAYLSTQYAFTGKQSLVMSGSSSSAAFQKFDATPGTSYTASLYATTPAGDPFTGSTIAQVQLLYYDANWNLLSSYTPPNNVTLLTASSARAGRCRAAWATRAGITSGRPRSPRRTRPMRQW